MLRLAPLLQKTAESSVLLSGQASGEVNGRRRKTARSGRIAILPWLSGPFIIFPAGAHAWHDYDASVGERPMKLIHFVFKKLNWFVLSRFIFFFSFLFSFCFFCFSFASNNYLLPLSMKESIFSLKICLSKNRFLEVNNPQIHINLSHSMGRI